MFFYFYKYHNDNLIDVALRRRISRFCFKFAHRRLRSLASLANDNVRVEILLLFT